MKLETTPYSPEWYAARESINRHPASLAAIALGIAPGREELIKTFALGTEKEIGTYLQKLFDKGHEAEEGFRNAWFAEHGQYFEPGCYATEDGYLQATVDGFDEETEEGMEHKLINQALFESVSRGIVPKEYLPQNHQSMICAKGNRWLFAVSNGTLQKSATVWVDFDSSWEQRLRDGWAQFDRDVAEFQKNGKIDAPERTRVVAESKALAFPAHGEINYLDEFYAIKESLYKRREEFETAIDQINQTPERDLEFEIARQAIKVVTDLRAHDKSVLALFKGRVDLQDMQECIQAFEDLDKAYAAFANGLQRQLDTRREQLILDLIQESNAKITAFKHTADKFTTPISCDSVVIDWPRELKSKTIEAARKHAATVIANAKITIQNQHDRIVENLVWLDDKENPDADWISRIRGSLNLNVLAKQDPEAFKMALRGRIAQEKLLEAERVQRAEEAARKKILAEQEEQLHIKENEARLKALRDAEEAAPTVDITPELADALVKAKEQATIAEQEWVDGKFYEAEPSEDDYPEYVTAYPEGSPEPDNPLPIWNPCLLDEMAMLELAARYSEISTWANSLPNPKKRSVEFGNELIAFLKWAKEVYIDGQV